MKADKIYLVGFMAAGKSTVAEALGRRLGWNTVDLDTFIEAQEHRSVSEIFEQDGEAHFRRLERQALRSLLPQRRVVVATGGGTFADAADRALIARDGATIWLDVSFDTVVRRLPNNGKRPLARDLSAMRALWTKRRAAYQLAALHVNANGVGVDELVDQIAAWLEP